MIRLRFAFLAALGLAVGIAGLPGGSTAGAAPAPTAATPTPARGTTPIPLASASPEASPTDDAVTPSPSPLPGDPTSVPTGVPSGRPGRSLPAPTLNPALQSLFGSAFPNGPGAAPQSYTTFLRNAHRETGLIDLVKKDDETYFDLDEKSFGKQYLIAPVLASGVSSSAFAGRVYDPFLISFKRVGRRILWIVPNPHYTAPPNSAALASLQISTADSILASSPIVAEDTVKHRVVIAPAIFLTDFLGVGHDIGRSNAPTLSLFGLSVAPGFSVDASRSYYEKTKALPKNDELQIRLTFSGPPSASVETVPDSRGVPLSVHYSIVEKPADGYVPRAADDRIGYFVSARESFANDNQRSPFERYINRWDISKGPIVFYITKEVPKQYRETVKNAILAWNGAFAKIGKPNAIEVRDQPDDPNWDPDDVRYSVVRWLSSDDAAFSAYSPSIADPQTGQIIRAEVVIEGESLRSIKRGFVERIVPLKPIASAGVSAYRLAAAAPRTPLETLLTGTPPDRDAPESGLHYEATDDCDYESASAVEASIGSMALAATNATPQARERYANDWLYSVVLHETGHTLGLRHNFIAGEAYSLADVNNEAFTRTHGLGASVMAYNPTNLAPSGKPHGSYFQMVLGPWDTFTVAYGYRDLPPGREAATLHAMADTTSQRDLRWESDEDALGNTGLDPRVAAFDLSSDPLGYDRQQYAVVDELVKKLDRIYPRDDRPYSDERAAFITLLNEDAQTTSLVGRWIGGTYTSRDHRGQSGGTPPLVNVPRSVQRRAFDLLAQHVLSSHAFNYPPALLNDMATNHYLHWNSPVSARQDFPTYEIIEIIQDEAMNAVLNPTTVERVANAELRSTNPRETTTVADLFAWTRAAIFDDLAGAKTKPIAFAHRELQRRYLTLLTQIALLPDSAHQQIDIPHQTESMARYTLAQIDVDLRRSLGGRIADVDTRAHLMDLETRTHQALNAQIPRGI